MEAYDEDVYRFLCGTGNKRVLELSAETCDFRLTLEIVLLYIPELVEDGQLGQFTNRIAEVGRYSCHATRVPPRA